MKAKVSSSILILHHIRSAENVGSLFRTADAAGISKLYLSSITATPFDRFGRPNAKVAKTALGAEQNLPWESYEDVNLVLATLAAQGYQIVVIEQSETSVDYKEVTIKYPVAFVLGNEVDGVPAEIVAQAHIVAEIPMCGMKESLNVAVAGGIALFRMLGR